MSNNKVKEKYLFENCKEEITDLLNDDNDSTHVSINLNLVILKEKRPILYKEIMKDVWKSKPDWDKALLETQKKIVEDGNAFLEPEFQIKENCHVRFINIPLSDNNIKLNFPTVEDVGKFIQIKGSIIRMAQERLLEFKREYLCSKCKETILFEAEYGKMYVFDVPKNCMNQKTGGICRGSLQPKNSFPIPNFCMDFQEIRLQEMFSKKRVPLSLLVCLENDLVDTCVPGECITICGTIEFRRKPLIEGKRGEVILTMHAVSISKDEKKVNLNKDYCEKMVCVRAQWEDECNIIGQLNARDLLIRSISPEIFGMYPVKLALALSLCSGMEDEQITGTNNSIAKRGNSHLLLIGDPGLAKSNLLKSATKISIRSVHTTGLGCSAAGLTAAAVREDGEFHLEAGALVLADGGVCCIDEFNLMREHDKGSIHEAMEQQTISIAKAGLVSKLHTRCVILAAANPRCLHTMSDIDETMQLNIGISSPLLSRFDLILILRDERNENWDSEVADHLLGIKPIEMLEKIWNLERLQSHFLAAQEIKPKFTTEAHLIVGSYYKLCRSDSYGDPARTTVRLLDSLNRLTQSHARLMLRSEVLGIDAVIVVRLMESTWGFGRLLTPMNVIKENLPFGPTPDEIRQVISILKLSNLEEKLLEELRCLEKNNLPNDNVWKSTKQNSSACENEQKRKSININDLERLFGYDNQVKKTKISNNENENKNYLSNIDKLEKIPEKTQNSFQSIIENSTDLNESLDLNESSDLNDCIELCNNFENSQSSCVLLEESNNSPKLCKTISPLVNDFANWDEDDLDLTLDILEKSNNSQTLPKSDHNSTLSISILKYQTEHSKLKKTVKKFPQEKVKITMHRSIHDDLDFDDADLELDDIIVNSNKINSGYHNENKSPIASCSKDISKKNIEKLNNNFSNPLLMDMNNIKVPNEKKIDNDSGYDMISFQNSILDMASQYDNLDFLDED